MTFHLNRKTGVVNRCQASPGRCPYDEVDHFETFAKGIETFEKVMEAHAVPESSDAYETLVRKHNRRKTIAQSIADEISERVKEDPEYEYSDQWFDRIQELKMANYALRGAEKPLHSIATQTLPSHDDRRESGLSSQNHHPEIKSHAAERRASSSIIALSGKTSEQVKKEVDDLQTEGMSKTEAYRKVWKTSEIRTDKPLVSIDLETSGAQWAKGYVDTGTGSEIIETGYIVRNTDGTTREVSKLYGVPEPLKSIDGTGSKQVHGITEEMVEGKTPIRYSDEEQKAILDDLRGSVLIAHNARFEKSQLSMSVRGFGKALQNGEIEVLDTQDVCKYFVPTATDNKNGSFAAANGVPYIDAHRALADAKTTLMALLANKNVKHNLSH